MLPKTRDGWFAFLVGLALAVMTAYNAQVSTPPLWAVLVTAGLGFLGVLSKGGAVSINPKDEDPDHE